MRINRFLCVLILGSLLVLPVLHPARAAGQQQLPAYERMVSGTIMAGAGINLLSKVADGNVIGELQAGDRILIDGRTDGEWLHVETYLGEGYLDAMFVELHGDPTRLPIVEGDLTPRTLPGPTATDDPQKYPILPVVTEYSKTIFKRGQAMGNHADVFSKVGDCMTADLHLFMGRFGLDNYDLGQYAYLQDVIDFFQKTSPRQGSANSFINQSFATETGFNASFAEDPIWLATDLCPEGDTPLSCELRLSKPSIAIIMFGTNDINALTVEQFDYFLRLVVFDTIDHGTIPLLSTFPGDPRFVDRTHQMNQIIYQIGKDYDVPVLNLWLALQPLPGHGRNTNSMYLSWGDQVSVSYFTPRNLKYGHTMRNLVTLQALDILWREVIKAD